MILFILVVVVPYTSKHFIFVTIICEQNCLFGSNAVQTLSFICPISAARIERKDSVMVGIWIPIIDYPDSNGERGGVAAMGRAR